MRRRMKEDYDEEHDDAYSMTKTMLMTTPML